MKTTKPKFVQYLFCDLIPNHHSFIPHLRALQVFQSLIFSKSDYSNESTLLLLYNNNRQYQNGHDSPTASSPCATKSTSATATISYAAAGTAAAAAASLPAAAAGTGPSASRPSARAACHHPNSQSLQGCSTACEECKTCLFCRSLPLFRPTV